MIRFAASVVGGFLLVTALTAQALAPQGAGQAREKQAVETATQTAAEFNGLLSSDYIAPAERRMLALQPQQCQVGASEPGKC
jgi:hypothetical protein